MHKGACRIFGERCRAFVLGKSKALRSRVEVVSVFHFLYDLLAFLGICKSCGCEKGVGVLAMAADIETLVRRVMEESSELLHPECLLTHL